MKRPPLLLGAAVLFWGWQTGLWLFALPIAVMLEGSRWLHWRWDFGTEDYRRIANLCLLLLTVFLIYLLVTNPSIYFIYGLMQWLPVVFFPLVAAQIYSGRDRLDIRALFFFLRSSTLEHPDFAYNLIYPYFALCLLAASAANRQDLSFYLGLWGLVALLLWGWRSRRSSPLAWFALMLVAGCLGFLGQFGLRQLHLTLEQRVVDWLSNTSGAEVELRQKNTSIGDLGLLKLSSGIVLRMNPSDRQTAPGLLRQVTYDKYRSATWIATDSKFTPISPAPDRTTWQLAPAPSDRADITIATTLRGDHSVLALPEGTFQLKQLPAKHLERNQYDTVKMVGKPGWLSYQAAFNTASGSDTPPTATDLEIPPAEKPAIAQVVSQLKLQNASPSATIRQVDGFFQRNFRYSLQLAGKGQQATPLATFLLQTRTGHCEYFATATTLLLRAAGIPARYAVGYSVHEFSNLENQFIVRNRHAHAWALAYVDGTWQTVDTTPADWTAIESTAAPWSGVSDFWAWLGFAIAMGTRQLSRIPGGNYVWWLMLPVLVLLVRRLAPQQRPRRLAVETRSPTSTPVLVKAGADSEFYLIEQAVNNLGWMRYPSESLKAWVERLERDQPPSLLLKDLPILKDLPTILDLHYRYRFDPAGLSTDERTQLKLAIQTWLDQYQASLKTHSSA